MKNLLSENLLRFGVKNLSESQKKELIVKSIMETIEQHGLHYDIKHRLMEQPDAPAPADANYKTLGTVNVVAKNPMGAKFAAQNKGKSFGALPINGQAAYFHTIPGPGETRTPVNLKIDDIVYNAPMDAKYDSETGQTTPSVGHIVFVLSSPGYVDNLRLNVSPRGVVSVVGQPKLGKVQLQMYDAKGGELLSGVRTPADLVKALQTGLEYSREKSRSINPLINGAAAVVASTMDTKPGVGRS